MKRENLTWQELWPLVGDGQCFDYQNYSGLEAFKFINGQLFFYCGGKFKPYDGQLHSGVSYKLVADPSQPQPKEATELSGKLYEELNARAKQIFDILEHTISDSGFSCRYKLVDQQVLVSGLVSMFELLREDLIWEIEERKS